MHILNLGVKGLTYFSRGRVGLGELLCQDVHVVQQERALVVAAPAAPVSNKSINHSAMLLNFSWQPHAAMATKHHAAPV